MKIHKIINTLFSVLFLTLIMPQAQAQSKVKVPETLHGFWHFEGSESGSWDGTSIGAEYVEFFYSLYYVDKVETQGDDGYLLWLRHVNGDTMKLTVSGLNNKQAKLQFSKWDSPKVCQLLEYPTNTEHIPKGEIPSVLFREWTIGTKGVVSCKFYDTDHLFYENKEWDILDAGYYLKKEYRMLIKSGNIYKMIYLNNISDKSLRLVCNMKQELLFPMASNKDIYKILGNWAQKSSNSWQLGFFEEFAIYNGGFWNYQSLKIKGSSVNIILNNKLQTVKISLKLKSEDICEVRINKDKKSTYFKCGKNMPAYSTPDSTSFTDTKFQTIDTVTIVGYLRNIPIEKPFSVSFNDPVKDDQVEFFADLDSLRRFVLKFPLINTTQVYLDWGRMTKVDVVEPGETYLLFYDFSDKQHLIMGDNERLHNELAAYEIYYANRGQNREEYMKRRSLGAMDFLKISKEELHDSYVHLNKYLEEHPFMSEKFKYYQQNYYRFRVAFSLMQRRFKLNRNTQEHFPEGFMEYINDTLYQNIPVMPYTLVREYLTFMRDYVGYAKDINRSGLFSVSWVDALGYMEKNGRIKFTNEENKIILKSEKFNDALRDLREEKADSAKMSDALIPYAENNVKLKEIFEKEIIKNFVKDEWPEIISKKFAKMRLDASLSVYDSLITDPLLKDIFEARKFYWLLDHEKTSMSDDMYLIFNERVTNPALAEPIIKLQEYYSQLGKQDILYVESLKKTDHLNGSKDADSLFVALTEPYRGKVIHLDFWGTWCGPCKSQMKYVGDVKEALKDKDVIFMYFANRSPEASWKNVIKENHLTGKNVVHYRLPNEQQAMIERRFSVRSFPTYILMDKEGNVVNMKAPRPQQKEQLVNEITKLLNQ